MTKELILKSGNINELFMAALLLCTSHYKDANVRIIKDEEEKNTVNVTKETVANLCPSWVSSELMSRMIQFEVCGPITDDPTIDVDSKVKKIQKALKKHAQYAGIELPK